ncbi:hypothetical protein ACH79_38040 [Bradyrhizobium sp. CCBAU 051011]|nr:hypothetical protein ACH79_38040 [Bradyrhizobium sp. CCBAU 051011]
MLARTVIRVSRPSVALGMLTRPPLGRIQGAENLMEHMLKFKLVATARGDVAATIGDLELPPLLDVRPIKQSLVENRHSNDEFSGGVTYADCTRIDQRAFECRRCCG